MERLAQSFQEALSYNIYCIFDQTIPLAIASAVHTACRWSGPKSAGGMLWPTYKATCRRHGVYTGAAGPRNFNAEMLEPIKRHLANGWERAFQHRLPRMLDDFALRAREHLKKFHESVLNRAKKRCNNVAGVIMLANQITAYSHSLTELPNMVKETVMERQREANRAFDPVIRSVMVPAYDMCVLESGKSSPWAQLDS